MKIVFFVVIILVILLVMLIPIRLKGVGHLNILSKEMFFSARHLFIPIISAKFYILANYELAYINEISKPFQKEIPKTKKKTMLLEMIRRMKVNKIDLIIDGGKEDDAFLTAIAIGSAYSIINTLCVISKDKISKSNIKINPSYNNDCFLVSVRANIGIRLYDIIKAIIMSRSAYREAYRKKEKVKEKKYAKI